jgi:hypothetical protein
MIIITPANAIQPTHMEGVPVRSRADSVPRAPLAGPVPGYACSLILASRLHRSDKWPHTRAEHIACTYIMNCEVAGVLRP